MLERRAAPILLLFLLGITAYRVWLVATNGLNLSVDEAQYWYWAQDLAWGYYSKPPVIAAIIAATTALGGDSEFWVRAGSLLFYPLSTWLLFLLGKRLFDVRTALVAAVLFITLPSVSLSSLLISTDVALFFFWTVALYAFVGALETDRWGYWLLLGGAVGLGMLSKYTMGIFFVSALLYQALTGPWRCLFRLRLWVAGLLAALIFAPNLWWNWQHGFPTFHHTADIAGAVAPGIFHWDDLAGFLAGQFGMFGLVLFPLFIWLAFHRTWGKIPQGKLLLSFSLPFLSIISLQALFGRANANWAAPTYVAATLLVAAWLCHPIPTRVERTSIRCKWLALALALNLLLGLGVYHNEALLQTLGVALNNKTDIQKRLRGWGQIGQQYLAIQRQYPAALLLANDRKLMSELMYYARPAALRGVSWNPQHLRAHQHYELVTTLDDKAGKDFLFVGEGALPGDVPGYFASVETVGNLHVAIHADYVLDYHVYLLKGFKGVAP